MCTQIYVNTHVALIFLSIFISVRLFLDDYMYTVCCLPGIHSLGHNEDNLIGRIWERKACIGKPSFEDEEKNIKKFQKERGGQLVFKPPLFLQKRYEKPLGGGRGVTVL